MVRRLLLAVSLLPHFAVLSHGQASAPNEDDSSDQDGFRIHRAASSFQAGETTVRVLLPDEMSENKRYRVLYVLPVVANADRRFGDGLLQIKRYGFHNKFELICVAPEFTAAPWFADHDSDPTKRDESHFLKVVLPLVEENYPALTEMKGRLLIGFSKSAWGAFALLLRHPEKFHRAAGWDPGIRIDTGPMGETERRQRIDRIFGSPENFETYRLSRLVRRSGSQLGSEVRLFYYSTQSKRAPGGAQLHQLMVELDFPHNYVLEPNRRHRWDSGWIPNAVDFLMHGAPVRN